MSAAWPRRAALGLVLVAALPLSVACGGDARKPPAAPSLASPLDAIPPDLDWVVRLDVGRIYATLGQNVVQTLREKAPSDASDGAVTFVTDALAKARVVVVAARYENGAFRDYVAVLEGDFRGLDPRRYPAEPPWHAPLDLGGDVRRWDRKKPKNRSDVARLYARGNDLVVAATEAELDAVEAVLERGTAPNPLRPRERGVVSLAVRARSFAAGERFPLLGAVFRSVQGAEGFVDTHADGFRVEASCELGTEMDAKNARDLVEAARLALEAGSGRYAKLARHTTIEAQGAIVVARAELGREVLGELLGEALR
ncbi:MAG TPA: hypothetical protein VFZ53_09650 [Polyangiaceae bacterium]